MAFTLALATGVGALLQLLASTALAFAPASRVQRVLEQSGLVYLSAVAIAAITVAVIHQFRQRLGVLGAATGYVGLIGAWAAMTRLGLVTPLGLCYRGELILYHFNALLASLTLVLAARVAGLEWRASRNDEPGPRGAWFQHLPVVIACLAVASLLSAHLFESWQSTAPADETGRGIADSPAAAWALGLGSLFAVTVAPLGIALTQSPSKPQFRNPGLWLGLAACLPLWTRVLVASPSAFLGQAASGDSQAALICIGVAISALILRMALRTQQPIATKVATIMFGATISFLLFAVYSGNFGQLEHRLDPLARSSFGFVVPYPDPDRTEFPWAEPQAWMTAVFLSGLCATLSSVFDAFLCREHRALAVGLLLAVSAGLGLTSPHLTLCVTAGLAIVVISPSVLGWQYGFGRAPNLDTHPTQVASETTSQAVAVGPSRAEDIEALLSTWAAQLDCPAPVHIDDGRRKLWSLRTELSAEFGHQEVDVRARHSAREAVIQVEIGVPGQDKPELDLRPGSDPMGRGKRIPVGMRHLQFGPARALEVLDDRLIDLLDALASTQLELWDTGAVITIGTGDIRPNLASTSADLLHETARHLGRSRD